MTQAQIKQVQRLLLSMGNDPGVIDGIWGKNSQAALDAALAGGKDIAVPTFDDLVEDTLVADWWKDIKHFTRDEFACKCPRCGGFPVEPEKDLVSVLDDIREHFDAPTRISSGVRCAKHNAEVGGVAGSRHKLGKAADFCVTGHSSTIVKVYCDKLIKAGKLIYCYCIDGSYVHADIL